MNLSRLEFRNMTPYTELREYACARLQHLLALAPPGSVFYGLARRRNKILNVSVDNRKSEPILISGS